MKLHLPKALLAAVLAACLAWPAGAFTSTTTNYPTDSDTPTTFNGDIWTWDNTEGNLSSGSASYTKYGTTSSYAGNADITGPGKFYNYFFNGGNTDYVGNTLRFNGANANKTLTTDWGNYVWIGGIIVEAGNSGTYTLGRSGGYVTHVKLSGGEAVNMIINSDFKFLVGPYSDKSSFGSISIEKGGTWSIAKGKTLSLSANECTISFAENQTIDVTATGEGTGSATLQLLGTTTNSGTISIGKSVNMSVSGSLNNSGTLNLGSKISINRAITNTGTINAATGGTLVSLDDLSLFSFTKTYSGGVNGFLQSYNDVVILDGGTLTGSLKASFKGGTEVDIVNGKVNFVNSNDGIYWINEGTVTYDGSPATGVGNIADAIKLQLNGGTLQMTSSLTEQVSQGIRVSNNSTVQLDGTDVVLNKSIVTVDTGKTLTLTGNGNYVIASPGAAVTLGTGVQLGADWEGIVTISGGRSGSDLETLVKGSTSKIEFNGFFGWEDNKWGAEQSFNVKLTDAEVSKAWVNGAYKTGGADAKFSGDWSGSGTFVANVGGGSMNYIYSGDVSQWTGAFEKTGSGATELTFTGAASTVNATILRSVGNLAVIADANATFSKSVTADTFTVNADKTAIFSGAGQDYNIGTVAGSGTLKVTDGTLCLTTLSGNLTFAGGGYKGGTIAVGDSSSLTIDGTVTVASLSQLTASDSTIPTVNGYVTATYMLATGEESTISATDAKAVVGGVEYALAYSSDTKALTFSTNGSSGTYFVNTGAVNYDDAANATTDPPYTVDIDAGKTTGIVLNGADVTLNMHLSLSSVAVDKISVKNNATINLAKSDVVLNKSDVMVDDGKTLTLTGSGNYVIESLNTAITSLGTGISLGADWMGTVTISGGLEGSYFRELVNGQKSVLEFKGVVGWSHNDSAEDWQEPQTFNVKLTDNGATKAWVNGAYTTSGDPTSVFSGTWSGEGTFVASIGAPGKPGPRMHYTYSGDISGWTGLFEMQGYIDAAFSTLKFTGNATSVNAEINRTKGTLSVVADTDATFSKSVTADAVTVNAGKSAVFNGTLKTTTLTVNANTTLSGDGNVINTLAGTGKMLVNGGTTEVTSALTGTTAVEVTGGELTLAGGTAEGSGVVTVKDGGTLSLKGETSFANDTVTLEKDGVLTCSGDSVLKGTVAGSGTLKVESGSKLTVSGTLNLGATIQNDGELELTDSICFSSLKDLTPKEGITYSDNGNVGNGYISGVFYIADSYQNLTLNGGTFYVGTEAFTGGDGGNIREEGATGKAYIEKLECPGLYYVNSDLDYDTASTTNSAASNNTEGLVLNGGTLNMHSSLNQAAKEGITVAGEASICLYEGGSLEDVALTVEKKDGVKLTLDSRIGNELVLDGLNGNGTVSSGKDLLVDQGGDFTGSYDGAIRIGTAADEALQKLRADANLTVIGTAGTVEVTGLTRTDPGTPNVLGGIETTGADVTLDNVNGTTPTTVTLGSESSMVGGELEFTVSAAQVNANLAADKAYKPTVITGAKLDLSNVTLKVNEVDNTGFAYNTDGPEKDIILFVVSDKADSTVDNVKVDMSDCTWMTKYFTNFRVVQGSINVVADANTSRYAAHGQTPNGTAGLALAGKAMFHLNPQTQNPDGELAQVLDMLDAHIESGNKGAMDKLGAALAGSSLSAVGLALADDVQRQLRSIRNRTTTMGVNQCEVNEDMPYVNGWISGDGNYRQLSESGTDAGYQVSSWGGTVGVDVDVNPNLTLGVAVSALFGDYTGKAADTLTGDLDTQYVSLFARVSTGSWVNTFVGTLGRADVDLERTIPGIAGKTTYKTNGMMFGFLYEVARTFALNDEATTCVQPLFNMSFSHTTLDSATEGGTADTRLTTDSASLTQFSLGLGGRLQSIVGENEYNRASIFEARALLKLDFGDRYNKLNTALAALPTATVSTRSNEKGVIGAELGATLTIPLSQDAGSIFFDVNADFNADEVGVNGSVGYRVNF